MFVSHLEKNMDVETVVREKVEAFSSDKLEEMLMGIMKREFRFIEGVGAAGFCDWFGSDWNPMAAMSDKTGYGVAGILALGLIIATFIGGRSIEKMRSADDGITVKGVAEKRITSDLASWRGQITLIDKDLSAGYDKLQEQFKTSIEFLKDKGIPAESIEEGTIGTSTKYRRDERGHATSEVESFSLTQSFTVETMDVDLAKRLAKESTELLRSGIDFRSYAPATFSPSWRI